MRKFPFPRIDGPYDDLCIRSVVNRYNRQWLERYRSDLLLENTDKSVLYIIELTFEFESNLESNARRKKTKYKHLINEQL